jgi:hypothetical protein
MLKHVYRPKDLIRKQVVLFGENVIGIHFFILLYILRGAGLHSRVCLYRKCDLGTSHDIVIIMKCSKTGQHRPSSSPHF